ncbi:hypothetical protein [Methylobacterium brachythecii]|uniref:hypothetical protein n=1 Tax=Methylobacterium brachythecii TaxID=1176177 RepID=UPI00160C6C2D|nr:hypothetical protein [Methylobacterium brachythecii]
MSHGYEACCERWHWLPRSGVSRLVSQGRALVVGARSERCRRRLSPDQEAAVVASVYALGGVLYAARVHGLDESLVRTLLRAGELYDLETHAVTDVTVSADGAGLRAGDDYRLGPAGLIEFLRDVPGEAKVSFREDRSVRVERMTIGFDTQLRIPVTSWCERELSLVPGGASRGFPGGSGGGVSQIGGGPSIHSGPGGSGGVPGSGGGGGRVVSQSPRYVMVPTRTLKDDLWSNLLRAERYRPDVGEG